jgi:hypothetical protein
MEAARRTRLQDKIVQASSIFVALLLALVVTRFITR